VLFDEEEEQDVEVRVLLVDLLEVLSDQVPAFKL